MKLVLYVLLLSGISYVAHSRRFGRRPLRSSFGFNDDDDDSPKIFNYNQYLRSPHTTRVDSKSKVETLGGVLKGKLLFTSAKSERLLPVTVILAFTFLKLISRYRNILSTCIVA